MGFQVRNARSKIWVRARTCRPAATAPQGDSRRSRRPSAHPTWQKWWRSRRRIGQLRRLGQLEGNSASAKGREEPVPANADASGGVPQRPHRIPTDLFPNGEIPADFSASSPQAVNGYPALSPAKAKPAWACASSHRSRTAPRTAPRHHPPAPAQVPSPVRYVSEHLPTRSNRLHAELRTAPSTNSSAISTVAALGHLVPHTPSSRRARRIQRTSTSTCAELIDGL